MSKHIIECGLGIGCPYLQGGNCKRWHDPEHVKSAITTFLFEEPQSATEQQIANLEEQVELLTDENDELRALVEQLQQELGQKQTPAPAAAAPAAAAPVAASAAPAAAAANTPCPILAEHGYCEPHHDGVCPYQH